eukprot:gene6503-3142_t
MRSRSSVEGDSAPGRQCVATHEVRPLNPGLAVMLMDGDSTAGLAPASSESESTFFLPTIFLPMVWLPKSLRDEEEEMDVIRVKPLKRRGLSRFYSSKSQSFSNMELALSSSFGESALALGKSSSVESEKSGSSSLSSMDSDDEMCSEFLSLMRINTPSPILSIAEGTVPRHSPPKHLSLRGSQSSKLSHLARRSSDSVRSP